METLLDNLIKATGWSIIHSLWQGALIYALLLPSQMRILAVKAKHRYAFAYAANCFMLISFLFTFVSLFHWPADQHISEADHQQIAAISFHPTAITLSEYAEMAFPFVALLYTLGLFIQLYVVFKGYEKVQQLKNSTHTIVPAEWQLLFQRLANQLNIKKQVAFKLSAQVTVPLVLGYLKPVVLFPISLAMQMDIKQVEAILIHELSHVRRNDYVLNLVKTMIETILFFNPFVWLTGKLINIEREHACDDMVVSLTKSPLTYAHALLQLELLADKNTPPLALAATGTNQHLYQRIKRITDMKTNYMNSKQKLFAITLTIATIVSLAWINPAKSEKYLKESQLKGNDKITFNDTSAAPSDTTKKKVKKIARKKVKTTKSGKVISIAIDTITADPSLISINNLGVPDLKLNFETASDSLLTNELIHKANDLSIATNKLVWKTNPNISNKELNKIRLEIQKHGQQLQKKFNSPEYRAKMLKFQKDLQAKYNSPEEKAKLKALAAEAIAKANRPEEKLKWQAFTQNTFKILIPPNTIIDDFTEVKSKNPSIGTDGQVIQLDDMKIKLGGKNVVIYSEGDEVRKVKQTPEYIELKKKFDKDVEDLVNKKIKKNIQ